MLFKAPENDPFPLETAYRNQRSRGYLITIGLFVAAVAVAFISILCTTFNNLSMGLALDVLVENIMGRPWVGENDFYLNLVIWDYNAPRAIVAVFAGAGLAVGGCIMQSLMRNPLADPYTTGVASGASFGAALFLMLGFTVIPTNNFSLALTTNAIIFSIIPTVAIIAISKKKSITPTTMILAGIAIMYIFRASTSLMTLSADPSAVEQLYMWNVGSVAQKNWDNVLPIVVVSTVCSVLLMYFAHEVTIMTAGDKSARSMGVNTRVVRIVCLGLMAILTAVIVGFTGTIGFMGLVAPHVARMIVGSNIKYLLPCSAACGSMILVGCDLIAKMVSVSGNSLPVGAITSIVGGPIFILLLIKGARKVWY